MLSALVCLGRHTVTRHIATCGRQWVDWSADYRLYSRGRVDSEALFAPLRKTVVGNLEPRSPVVVGLDDTRLKNSGGQICTRSSGSALPCKLHSGPAIRADVDGMAQGDWTGAHGSRWFLPCAQP